MTGENVQHTNQRSKKRTASRTDEYDPFVRGRYPVGVRTIQALDKIRDRLFPCEIWYPAAAQHAGHDIASGTQDFFTVPPGDTPRSQMAVRNAAARPGTYPPIVFSLLDHLLNGAAWDSEANLDPTRIGIVGHSFGGWTALAAPDVESRIRAVVALAPGGSSQPRPGILKAKLAFAWGRDVPTLFLVAENDISLPLAGMYEIFERTPATKQMVILRRADHMHFMDNVEEMHEMVRKMPFTGELAWLPREMRPIAELCSGEQAHVFVRGLTLCHLDAMLRQQEEAQRFLAGDIEDALAARGVEVLVKFVK